MIEELLEKWIGLLLVLPWIIVVIGFLIKKRMRKKLRFKKIADWITIFLIVAVYALARLMIGAGIGYYLVIVILLIAIAYTVFEWRRNKDFMIMPTIYIIWRLLFLVFIILYVVLLVIAAILLVM